MKCIFNVFILNLMLIKLKLFFFLSLCYFPIAAHSEYAHGPWWNEPKWTPATATSWSQHAL